MKSIFDLKKCPQCLFNLDGGDIYENLRSMPEYKNYSDSEVKEFANSYGWSEENKVRASNLIMVDLHYICPQCKQTIKPPQ